MQGSRAARRQAIVVIIIATLVFCLNEYHAPFSHRAWDNMLFYVAIPLIAIFALRQNPLTYGLGIGDWKWTLGSTAIGAIGVALLLWLASYVPELRAYYRPQRPPPEALWAWLGLVAVELFAWEFLWRAFMLFGLESALGEMAIYVQMIPFAIAHIDKPEIETLSSIAGGILLGYLIRRCRSFWPAFLLHFFLYAGIHFI